MKTALIVTGVALLALLLWISLGQPREETSHD